MEVTFAQLSFMGPVRGNNEDFILTWAPADQAQRTSHGAVAIIADGVGGQGDGEVASRMAAELSLEQFQQAAPDLSLNATLWRMFNAANLAVYDAGMAARSPEGRMATTLVAVVFRHDQIGIGHVGDSRAYRIHQGAITQLTTDHTFVAFHAKLGLFAGHYLEKSSPLRGGLTRSIGKDPIVPVDFVYSQVDPGDLIILCTDGVHTFVEDAELLQLATADPPAEAVHNILGLCAARGTEDNSSVIVCRVDAVQRVHYYRGLAIIEKPTDGKRPMSQEIQPKEVVDDRFEIVETIAQSGMATIFKALDRTTGKLVALKVPLMQFESDPAFFSRFEREEQIGLALDHPAILKILPVANKSRPYIAMELLQGVTLDRMLQEKHPHPLETTQAVEIAANVADALAHMHERDIVHRDLKPANIMVAADGSLRIIDFGIAKSAGMRRVTFTGFSPAMGTPDYMAPEQVLGKRGDARTDIYSLGAMLYEMLTGHTPFDGENPYMVMQARITGDPRAPRSLNPALTPQLEEIILHAMARDPKDRYQTAREFEEDLLHPNAVTVTGRVQRLVTPQIWKTRLRRILRLGLLAAIPVGIVLTLWLVNRNSAPPHPATGPIHSTHR